jgi:hypothetical protein
MDTWRLLVPTISFHAIWQHRRVAIVNSYDHCKQVSISYLLNNLIIDSKKLSRINKFQFKQQWFRTTHWTRSLLTHRRTHASSKKVIRLIPLYLEQCFPFFIISDLPSNGIIQCAVF